MEMIGDDDDYCPLIQKKFLDKYLGEMHRLNKHPCDCKSGRAS